MLIDINAHSANPLSSLSTTLYQPTHTYQCPLSLPPLLIQLYYACHSSSLLCQSSPSLSQPLLHPCLHSTPPANLYPSPSPLNQSSLPTQLPNCPSLQPERTPLPHRPSPPSKSPHTQDKTMIITCAALCKPIYTN